MANVWLMGMECEAARRQDAAVTVREGMSAVDRAIVAHGGGASEMRELIGEARE